MNTQHDARGRFAPLSDRESKIRKLALHLLDHHMHRRAGETPVGTPSAAHIRREAGEHLARAESDAEYDAALALHQAARDFVDGREIHEGDLVDAIQPRGTLARAAVQTAVSGKTSPALRPALRVIGSRLPFNRDEIGERYATEHGLSPTDSSLVAHLQKRKTAPGKQYLAPHVTGIQYEQLAREALKRPAKHLVVQVSHGVLQVGSLADNQHPDDMKGPHHRAHTFSLIDPLRGKILTHYDAHDLSDLKLRKGGHYD